MFLYVIRTVAVTPALYQIGVSTSPDDRLESLRHQMRKTPIAFELAGTAVIDQRRALMIEGTVHHVLTALGLGTRRRGWFSGDADVVDYLNTDRLDAWFTSTPEIAKAANGYTLPAPRQAPEPTYKCQVRTGTKCKRMTATPCMTCNTMCCGPHQVRVGTEIYCRGCWRDQKRIWELEERAEAKAKARAAFERGRLDYMGYEDFKFS